MSVQQNRKVALVVPVFAGLGAAVGLLAGVEGAHNINPMWRNEHPMAGAIIGSAIATFMGVLVTMPAPDPNQIGTSGALHNPEFP